MSLIKVVDIAFVRFQAPDLEKMRVFLEDFGLRCFDADGRLYAAGSDGSPFAHVTQLGSPAFLGLGFQAETLADLERLAKSENKVIERADTPGGGHRVRLTDPDGFEVDIVAGQERGTASPLDPDVPFNSAAERRRFRTVVRVRPGPSQVRRLGHAVLMVSDFSRSERWYKDRFGLITSDQVEIQSGIPIGAFLRCDRGHVPTDHHTLFLAQALQGPGFNHAAFEVGGFDDLMTGHTYLKSRQHSPAWGVGRHVLGSQIFDYWKDPWGHELEHWTDGDLLTAADAPGVASLEELLGTQWGSPHPLQSDQY